MGRRAGWTLSSFLVADGDPGEVIGLVDEESALADILPETTAVTVNLLGGVSARWLMHSLGLPRRLAGLFHLLPGTTRTGARC